MDEEGVSKYPKATAEIVNDFEELLAFYDLPAEHWTHLRTTNPIILQELSRRRSATGTDGPVLS